MEISRRRPACGDPLYRQYCRSCQRAKLRRSQGGGTFEKPCRIGPDSCRLLSRSAPDSGKHSLRYATATMSAGVVKPPWPQPNLQAGGQRTQSWRASLFSSDAKISLLMYPGLPRMNATYSMLRSQGSNSTARPL